MLANAKCAYCESNLVIMSPGKVLAYVYCCGSPYCKNHEYSLINETTETGDCPYWVEE